MIKVKNIDWWGFDHAIRGMRNPMNSWHISDSGWHGEFYYDTGMPVFTAGQNDLDLMRRLYKAGTEHRKYLRQIMVSMDIIAPLYWWKEFDTYKIGTVANSCSTMHKIHVKAFTLEDFSYDHLDGNGIVILQKLIDKLNLYRGLYNELKDKRYWWQIIQLLPTSYNQRRTVTMNYENVVSMINQRTGHKLDEWHEFIEVLKKLPYVAEIIGE